MTNKDDELLEKQDSIELTVDPVVDPPQVPAEVRPLTRRIVSSQPHVQQTITESADLPYASFGRRLIACLIDAAILGGIGALVSIAGMVLAANLARWDDLNNGFWFLQVFYGVTIYAAGTIFPIVFPFLSLSRFPLIVDGHLSPENFMFTMLRGYLPMIVIALYFAWQESRFGGTIGKRLMGIKVTDLSGHNVTFPKALQRNVLKGVSTAMVCLGYLLCLVSQRRQTFHDQVSNCLVVLGKHAANHEESSHSKG